ncbi:hypothetical protein LCGC14_2792080 [marine sediment metagenome]|uniref:Rubredoxin-like domain-containing protein n=1 Tax=marine sediment metagenome TaxID=412755 RepID=A0A0F9AYV7_9ZZZZ
MTQPTTPANDIETARRHHKRHGDMDGKTCLLSECALHYPRPTTYTCKVCGYTWTPRPKRFEQGRSKPIQCPHCQSKDWDKQGS